MWSRQCLRPIRTAPIRPHGGQPDLHAYNHVDLLPLRPVVTRIHRHRGVCPCCRKHVAAAAPQGFAPGSPFGPELCALITHLHATQAIGFERLARLLAEVFGLTLSEGMIAKILARAEAPLLAATARITAAVRTSPVAGCDETSARVADRTRWQWVLLGSTAICHLTAETRAACIVTAFLDDARPADWMTEHEALSRETVRRRHSRGRRQAVAARHVVDSPR